MNININKYRKIILYILFLLFFILWMLFSNSFFASFSPDQLTSRQESEYKSLTKVGYGIVDNIVQNDTSLIEDISMSGWALIPTYLSNASREIELVFISKENTYSVNAHLKSRPDVFVVYSDIYGDQLSDLLGYEVEFSTATMKNGIYTLDIYCWENEQDYGLVHTGRKFIKQGTTFKEYIFQSEAITQLTPNEDLTYGVIDIISVVDSFAEITGWTFLEDVDSSQQEVYVQLTSSSDSKVYTTEQKARTDVAAAYENELYTQSGYTARIPMDQLAAGSYHLEILVKFDNRIASAAKGTMTINSDGTVTYDTGAAEAATFISQEVAPLTANEILTYHSVDVVSAVDSTVEITGWALLEDVDSSQQEVYLQLTDSSGSKTYTTEQKTRTDVAEAYENELYTQSGYTAKIPMDQLETGSYDLEIFVKSDSRIASIAKGTIQLLEDGTVSYTR